MCRAAANTFVNAYVAPPLVLMRRIFAASLYLFHCLRCVCLLSPIAYQLREYTHRGAGRGNSDTYMPALWDVL